MKTLSTICVVVALVAVAGVAQANTITLTFNANDVYNYATSDDTRVNQQGTARRIDGSHDGSTPTPTGTRYLTYNDGSLGRDTGATAAQDLQSVANILSWSANGGYQGVSWLQLYLQGGNGPNWGEKVVLKSGAMSPSVNGEYDWTATLSGSTPVFNTVLGGAGHQNAISSYHPADKLWSVTGDFFVDVNENGTYESGTDTDLVAGQDYTLWFEANLNNWTYTDDYGNATAYGPAVIEGTLIATAVPEPTAWCLLGIGALIGLLGRLGRKRRG